MTSSDYEVSKNLHALLLQFAYVQRDFWKHLHFTAYHLDMQRLELGEDLADCLHRTVHSMSPLVLAQTYRDQTSVLALLRQEVEQRSGSLLAERYWGFERVGERLTRLGDPILLDLWKRGTWAAMYDLLALNLMHVWSPTHDLWNSPGYQERHAALAEAVFEVSESDWDLIVRSARAFPALRVHSKAGRTEPAPTFVTNSCSYSYDPLNKDEDAERLAGELRIGVRIEGSEVRAAVGGHDDLGVVELLSANGGNERVAARRAVTRAAVAFLESGRPRAFRFR